MLIKLLKKQTSEIFRQAILVEAIKILEIGGIEKVTIRQIAQGLGCSTGALYNYFKDKNEILKEIYLETCRQFLKELKTFAFQSKDTSEDFLSLMVFVCEFRIRYSYRYREIFLHQAFEKSPEELQQIRNFIHEKLKALKLKGLPTHSDVEKAQKVLLALAEGLANLAQRSNATEEIEQYLETMKVGMKALLKGWSQNKEV